MSNESFQEMNHATLKLPKPTVGVKHPFNNPQNHDKLLMYLKARLRQGAERRDAELDRLVRIDKNVAGWMKLSEEDRKRLHKKDETGLPQATLINLPLSFVHLDDMMTYFAQTFSPTRGMFYHTGKPEEVGSAAQIVTIMNNHAIYAGYYRELLQGVYSLLKYNTGGFQVYWSQDQGPDLAIDADGKKSLVTKLRWQGNRMESIDKYNFLYDPHVHPTKIHCDGEFAATIKMKSYFWLQNAAANGAYYNCEDALTGATDSAITKYYRNPPQEAMMDQDQSTGGTRTDWRSILGGYRSGSMQGGFELAEIHIKLDPTDFGLVGGTAAQQNARSRYEMWRFTVLNDKYIIDATYMNNVHGYLPFFLGVLNDDLMGTSQKSNAEILQPLQDFASFLLNTHILGNRKNLWGHTYYDPSMFDLKSIPEGEVAARVPMKPEAQGRDIRTGLSTPSNAIDTKQTMGDLSGVIDIINQFFPTQSLPSQIANIDRAVDSQVAAVQQGANRRQQKSARLLDDSVFRNVRYAMYYNLIQYQPDGEDIQDFYSGKQVTIDLGALKNTDLPFIIGQGLKAIDRQAAAHALQQIIFALIQAPQAAQRIDLLGLMDYWTSMIDIDLDMTKFELAPPAAPAVPGQPAAGGAAITPVTSPQAVTAPIYSTNATGQ